MPTHVQELARRQAITAAIYLFIYFYLFIYLFIYLSIYLITYTLQRKFAPMCSRLCEYWSVPIGSDTPGKVSVVGSAGVSRITTVNINKSIRMRTVRFEIHSVALYLLQARPVDVDDRHG